MGVTGEVGGEVGEDGGEVGGEVCEDGSVLGCALVPYHPHPLFLRQPLLPALCVLRLEERGLDGVEDEGSKVRPRVERGSRGRVED
eukprot:2768914-Rhodomonas_salina.1